MEKYNAGYKLIEELNFSDHHYVLGHMPHAPAPYVTWETNATKDAFIRGHYFAEQEDALVDLFRRAGKDLPLSKPLAIALLQEEDIAAIQRQYREETARESVCALLEDLLDQEEEFAYDYEGLLADPDFMSMATDLYHAIDHSYENEAFTDNLKMILEDFPQYKQKLPSMPAFRQEPEPVKISPEEATLLNDLLNRPSAQIPKLYGPFGDGFDFVFALDQGFSASLEMLPTYDKQRPNQLSETEPPHIQVQIKDPHGNCVYDQIKTANDLNHTITGAHAIKDDHGQTILTLKIEQEEALRRIGRQFQFHCAGGDEHITKHDGEHCIVRRALTGNESDILINGLMWEAEFSDGDKLHIFDRELVSSTEATPEKLPLSKQIDLAREKIRTVASEHPDPNPER